MCVVCVLFLRLCPCTLFPAIPARWVKSKPSRGWASEAKFRTQLFVRSLLYPLLGIQEINTQSPESQMAHTCPPGYRIGAQNPVRGHWADFKAMYVRIRGGSYVRVLVYLVYIRYKIPVVGSGIGLQHIGSFERTLHGGGRSQRTAQGAPM